MQYFVAEEAGRMAGYIHWSQKSGFHTEVVLEIEQIAVYPDRQGRGIGEALIINSLPEVNLQLQGMGAELKHIIVTTRADNAALQIYRKTLGVEIGAVIKSIYPADEVLMVARCVEVPQGATRYSSSDGLKGDNG
jgi:ribosomal protein S18 acetylase RimI-like enzyme